MQEVQALWLRLRLCIGCMCATWQRRLSPAATVPQSLLHLPCVAARTMMSWHFFFFYSIDRSLPHCHFLKSHSWDYIEVPWESFDCVFAKFMKCRWFRRVTLFSNKATAWVNIIQRECQSVSSFFSGISLLFSSMLRYSFLQVCALWPVGRSVCANTHSLLPRRQTPAFPFPLSLRRLNLMLQNNNQKKDQLIPNSTTGFDIWVCVTSRCLRDSLCPAMNQAPLEPLWIKSYFMLHMLLISQNQRKYCRF